MDNNSLGTIWSEIGINYQAYDQAVDHIARQNSWLDAETQKAMNNISQHYSQMGKSMSIAITAPLTLLGRQWINTFAGFQQSMANTQSVIGATAAELEKLTAAARVAGEETVFKASQAADALYYLAQSGMDAAQSISALDGVLTLAVASQSDLAYTSEVVAATLSQFSMEAGEASRVANLFAAANSESLASLDKLAGAMKNAGPVAAGFGYTIEETTAALMGLLNAGFQGEQAGNILKRALSELANPTGDAIHVINELKLSAEQLHPEMNSIADILDLLNERGITSTQSLRLFGQIAGPGMSQLLGQGGDAVRNFTENITGTNKAAEQAAIQLDTLSGDVKIMASVYESLAITMTDNFEPALRQIVRQITELLGWIRDLNPEAQKFTVVIAGFAAAAGPTMLIVSQLLKALPLLFGPAGWIYAGVAAVTALGFALAASGRDMGEFYQQSIDGSRAARDQAEELRRLVDEYKELEGKPDKSEQEHKRLQTVMEEIIRIQPKLAAGYDTIDEAIKNNIGTLETYTETLKTQSELQLRVASLEYLRQRNQLEHELNKLQEEREQIESRLGTDIEGANKLVSIASNAELAFMRFVEAIETNAPEVIEETMKEMQQLLIEFEPGHVVKHQADRMSPWGIWIDQLRREARKVSAESADTLAELDKIIERTNEIIDTQAHGQAVIDELRRLESGTLPESKVPETVEPIDASSDGNVENVITPEELEKSLRAEMELYRARVNLARHAGDEFAEVYGHSYGNLQAIHDEYATWLGKNVYDRELDMTEEFRARMAVELGGIREDIERLIESPDEEIETDPNTIVTNRMQVFRAELDLLRLGIDEYVEELGSLEEHLAGYSEWLETQLVDTGLSEVTHARIAQTRADVETEMQELAKIAEQASLSATDRVEMVFASIGKRYSQGIAAQLKEALTDGKIYVDYADLENAVEHVENYYEYLVATKEISLGDQLEVVEHRIFRVAAGSREWLDLWYQKLRLQEQISAEQEKEEAGTAVSISRQNEVLQSQLERYEQLKHINDETANTYERQAEWLEKNILNAEGVLQTDKERRDIENEVFNLRMSHFRELAQTEGWNTEEQIKQLQHIVGAHASSFQQLATFTQMQSELQSRLTRQQEQDDDERIKRAQEVADRLLQLEIERLQNLGRVRDAETMQEYSRYQRDLRSAGDDTDLQDIAKQSYKERLRSLGIRDAEKALKESQEIDYRIRQNEIQRLRNSGEFQEAEFQQANLALTRSLNQYRNNQKMMELAREEHGLAIAAIIQKYDEQERQEEERKLAEQRRLDEQWQSFLLESRQTTHQTELANQISNLELEYSLLKDDKERKIQLERELEQAKFELRRQELDDQRALLDARLMEEELDTEDRLDLLARISKGYQDLYGDQYQMSQEWQQIRQQELALEKQAIKDRIDEIEVNNKSIASIRNKQQELLNLIDATESYAEKQEYLNELLATQEQIQQAQNQTLEFFTKISPKVGEYTKQIMEMNQLIRQSPQAFDNMRVSMNEMFGDYGDGLAALYGAVSGYSGAGGDIPGVLAGISGAVAGFTGNPLFAAISSGISLIGQLFDPGPVPQEMQSLTDGIDEMNDALLEFGVSYRATEAEIKKERFLGFMWQTGWKITNEEAAKAGYETGQIMIDSMNASLSALGSVMAQAISGQATWDDFEKVLGQQLKRIILEQAMIAAEVEQSMKLLAGMIQEYAVDGFTVAEIEEIKDFYRQIVNAANEELDKLGYPELDDIFPEDGATVSHEVRGVQITRLAGQDRDMFGELFRPLTVLDQLPGLLSDQMNLYQEYQVGQIAQLHATEIIMETVYIQRAEFHGPIQTLNLNGEALEESLDRKIRSMTDEAFTRTDGSGN